MNEKPLVINRPGSPLVGMLHPATGKQETGVLMMVAGGPQYRIGGHRQMVIWARKLSSRGFPVFRFDFAGMGDSYGKYVEFEDTENDIRDALTRFFEEVPSLKRVVLWGECNASSSSLLFAYKDQRVKGIVMINPWVRTEQGQAKAVVKHYYLDRLKQRSFWLKVLTLKFDLIGSMKSAMKMISLASGAPSVDEKNSDKSDVDRNKPLPDRMLDGLSRFKGQVMLVLSGRDMISKEFDDLLQTAPAWGDCLAACSLVRHDLQYADHTFSSGVWRDQVAEWGIDWLADLEPVREDKLNQVQS